MRIAVFQPCTGINPSVNAERLVDAIAQAKAGRAEMLFTPEMSGVLDRDRARAAISIKAEADDPVLAAVRGAARNAGIWVNLGSLALKSEKGDGCNLNRSFVIDPDGQVRATYDKLHLFDVDLPNGEAWRESSAYAPGDRAVVMDLPWGRLGLSICYDLRFPDLYRALSNACATMLSIPAAFTVPTGQAHWHILLRARAIESGAFVIAAAQAGHHEDGRNTFGHSLVVDPWGEVLLDMGDQQGIGFVDIDLGRVNDVRARIPVLKHRRAIPNVEVLD